MRLAAKMGSLVFCLLLSSACVTVGKAPPPADYAKLVALAGLYQQQGRFSASEPLLREALRSRPRGAEANALMGDASLVKGEFGAAVLHYRISLGEFPSQPLTLNNLAMAELGLGKGQEALTAIDAALALPPPPGPASFPRHALLDTRARSLAKVGRTREARSEGERALSLWPASDPEGKADLESFLSSLSPEGER